MEKKLTRSNDKKICGVCSGLAKYLNLDPTIARIAFAALTLFTGAVPGIVIYAVMAFVMPEE